MVWGWDDTLVWMVALGALLFLLVGCASLPDPDAQVRITEGDVGARGGIPLYVGGEGTVHVCIVSIVGQPDEKLMIDYQGDKCTVTWGGLSE